MSFALSLFYNTSEDSPLKKNLKRQHFCQQFKERKWLAICGPFKMELGWAKKSKKNYVPVVSQMVYLSLLPATMADLVDFSKAVGLYACKVKDL